MSLLPLSLFLLQTPTFTYSGPVDRLDVVLAALGERTGQTLLATPKLGDVPVYLRCQDQPQDVVLAQLAQALNARWEKDAKGYRLVRDIRDERREKDEDEALAWSRIEKGLAKQRKQVAEEKPWTTEEATTLAQNMRMLLKEWKPDDDGNLNFWRRQNRLERQSPGARGMRRALLNLDPRLLAELPRNEKVVFSDKPTRAQYPLPAGIAEVARQAVRDQNVFIGTFKGQGMGEENYRGGPSFESLGRKEPISDVSRIWFSLFRNQEGSYVQAELKLLDAKGRSVLTASDTLSGHWSDEDDGGRFQWWKDEPVQDGTETLKIAPERKPILDELNEARGSGVRRLKIKRVEGPLRERLLYPERYEPMGYLATDIVEAILPKSGPAVAIVPDSVGTFAIRRKNPWPLGPLKESLKSAVDLQTKDGWHTLRPLSMGQFYKDRPGREVQGAMIRTLASGKQLTIEERAAIAFRMGDQAYDELVLMTVPLLIGEADFDYFGGNMYRLYGSLSRSQNDAARGPGLIYRTLSPEQQKIVREQIYGAWVYLQHEQPAMEEGAQAGEAVAMELDDWETWYNGVAGQPTELLPNGPANVTIKITESRREVVVPDPGNYRFYFGPQTAEEYANQAFYATRPDLFPWAKEQAANAPTKFRYANQRRLNVKIYFTPTATMNEELEERDYTVREPVPFSQLPEEFRKKVAEFMAQMKENYKDVKPGQFGGGGGGSTIPPL